MGQTIQITVFIHIALNIFNYSPYPQKYGEEAGSSPTPLGFHEGILDDVIEPNSHPVHTPISIFDLTLEVRGRLKIA